MHSPNVVRLVMAESGRGREVVITPIPDFPEKNGALASQIKNKFATTYRAVSISFYFQGQDFNVKKYVLHCRFRSLSAYFMLQAMH